MTCDFCKDEPVGNARRWTDPTAPMFAACPRCGVKRTTLVLSEREQRVVDDVMAMLKEGE